ncbi:MAG: glycine cleavage system aminomethyltransferase GcvT [Bacteroidia bacterium]
MKNTALTSVHEALGAKMVPFAGYNMPVLYTNLIQEHLAVRNAMGVFDVSHMGEVFITGPHAYDLIEYMTSNDVASLYDGRVQYSCMPNDQGGIVDDLLVYRYHAEKYLLVINASNIDKDLAWMHTINEQFGADIRNASEEYSLLAVQGPKASEALQTLTDTDLSGIEYYHFTEGQMAGLDCIISCSGYTGAGGFELYVSNADAEALWNAVMKAGEAFGVLPCGLGSRDTLRLEKGFCLYGNDINDETSPIEAGLGWITKFNQPFMMSEHHLAIKTNKPSKKLVGFELMDRGIPRQHYPICSADGTVIGEVTSGTQSPSLNKAIGLGYVPADLSKAGSEIYIEVRGKLLKAVVTKIPFL